MGVAYSSKQRRNVRESRRGHGSTASAELNVKARHIGVNVSSSSGVKHGLERSIQGHAHAGVRLEKSSRIDETTQQLGRKEKQDRRLKKSVKLGAKNDSLEDLPNHWIVLSMAGLLDFALFVQGCSNTMAMRTDGMGNGNLPGDLFTTGLDIASMAVLGYVLADLGTGIFHWSVDNYGSGKTPIFGNVIAAFQGHHRQPWSITVRGAANNLAPLATPSIAFLLLSMTLPVESASAKVFLSSFILFVVLSQHFHRLSHCKPSKVSPLVRLLQANGILLSTADHAAHHKVPFNNNYCIVNGMWNKPLDSIGFFPLLEKVVYNISGVEPRCWNEEPDYDWIESTSYYQNEDEEYVSVGDMSQN